MYSFRIELIREPVTLAMPARTGVFRISPDGAKTDRAKQDLTANVFLSRDCVSRAYSNDVDVRLCSNRAYTSGRLKTCAGLMTVRFLLNTRCWLL